MTVDHLKMLQATGGKGKLVTSFLPRFLPFSFHFFLLKIVRKSELNSSLTSWDRRSQIKAVEINANGRIELVGKNFWNKRSTWPWACVCFHSTVGVRLHSQQPGQRFVWDFQKCMLEFVPKTKQTHKHPNINRRLEAVFFSSSFPPPPSSPPPIKSRLGLSIKQLSKRSEFSLLFSESDWSWI